MRHLFLGVVAVAWLVGVTLEAQSIGSRDYVTFPNGTKVGVEIADTEATRARGLMFRNDLAQDRGMIFLFDQSGRHSFWMKNTVIPLDILWLDQSGRIVSIAHAVPPCHVDPCPSYTPRAEALAVVEVVSGFAKQHGLKMGDKVELEGAADFISPIDIRSDIPSVPFSRREAA